MHFFLRRFWSFSTHFVGWSTLVGDSYLESLVKLSNKSLPTPKSVDASQSHPYNHVIVDKDTSHNLMWHFNGIHLNTWTYIIGLHTRGNHLFRKKPTLTHVLMRSSSWSLTLLKARSIFFTSCLGLLGMSTYARVPLEFIYKLLDSNNLVHISNYLFNSALGTSNVRCEIPPQLSIPPF